MVRCKGCANSTRANCGSCDSKSPSSEVRELQRRNILVAFCYYFLIPLLGIIGAIRTYNYMSLLGWLFWLASALMGYLSFYRLSTYHNPVSGKYAFFSPAGWASIWIIFSANLVVALQWDVWKLLWLLLAGW